MTKIPLDYVISASSRLRLYDSRILERYKDEVIPRVVECMNFTRRHLKENCKYTDPTISVLYNGFIENEYPKYYKKLNNLGCDYIYADSGGLQIVTLGKTVTPEIKQKIYGYQEYADFAMCFDEIPLERVTKNRNSVERVVTDNKLFNTDRLEESAKLTGQNIRQQIEHFQTVGAKTKVMLIAQGNCAEDMVEFFNGIMSQLLPKHLDSVAGLAVADTCMGNGPAESVEMLKAARLIGKVAPEQVTNQLHFLGVGSINRMRPIVYLLRSGYLNSYRHISYDSSTISSTYDFGKIVLDEEMIYLGMTKTREAVTYFSKVYEFYGSIYKNLVDLDTFLTMVFGNDEDPEEKNIQSWKNSAITQRVDRDTDANKCIAALLARPSYLYYQMGNFIQNVDNVFKEKRGSFDNLAISSLMGVTDDETMQKWERNHGKHMKSKRIKRKENITTLGDIF